MNIKIIKITSIVTSLFIMTAPLTACSDKKEITTESTSSETSISETTTISETVATIQTSSDTVPSEEPSEFVVNPLTGMKDMDKANEGKRGIGIAINNCLVANPSRGTSDASVIFEYETEGGQTRMLAVYADISKIPLLGSIRSGRVGAADMCAGTGCIFASWGCDTTAVPARLREYDIDWVDLNSYIYDYGHGHTAEDVPDGKFCWYDSDWKSERSQEHCGVSRGDFLQKAVEHYGYETNEEIPELFQFVEDGTATMTDAKSCSEINVYFSSTNDDALFVYDEDENVYYKSQYNGQPQMDINNNVQIHFTNVFVLYCPINIRPGDTSSEKHKDIHMEEGGVGYYVSNGQLEEITWTKPTPNDQIKCFDKNGTEIQVNAGKSYICVVDEDYFSKTTYKE